MSRAAKDFADRHDDGYELPWNWGYTDADYLPLEAPAGYVFISGDQVEDHITYMIHFVGSWKPAVRRPGYLHIPYWYSLDGLYITADTNVEAYAERETSNA